MISFRDFLTTSGPRTTFHAVKMIFGVLLVLTISSPAVPLVAQDLGNHPKAAIGYHLKSGHSEEA